MKSIVIVCLLFVIAGLLCLLPRTVEKTFEISEQRKAIAALRYENEKAKRASEAYQASVNASK